MNYILLLILKGLRLSLTSFLLVLSLGVTAQSTYTHTQDEHKGKELEEIEGGQFVFEGTERGYSGPIFKNWTNGDIPCERGIVEKGFRHGPWKYFFMGGPLETEGIYDNGNPIGDWVSYHFDGELASTFSYDNHGIQQGEELVYYKNGQLKEKKTYVNDLLEGKAETFYSDGSEHEIKFYLHSKKNGQFLTYYENGDLEKEENYVNNRKEGKFISTYKSGKTRRVEHYLNGGRQGESKTFFESGELKGIGAFIDDKHTGIHYDFRENGDTMAVREWKDKKIISQIEYHSDGSRSKFSRKDENGKKHGIYLLYHKGFNVIREQWTYDHGVKVGEFRKTYKSGRLAETCTYENGEKQILSKYYDFGSDPVKKSETHYKDGKRNGITLSFHKDGKISMEGANLNGRKDGQYTWYGSKKILSKIETYTFGKMDGLFEEYYKDGELEAHWFCVDGKKEGEYVEYYSSGQVKEQCIYVKGKRHGHFVSYRDDATVKREGEYDEGMRQGVWIEYDKEVEYINDVEQ